MSEGIKIPLAQAKEEAEHVLNKLRQYCSKIDIAGSIRKEKEMVGDIEIICRPIKVELFDMFGESKGFANSIFFCGLLDSWQIIKGSCEGKYTQRILPSGTKLDLFMPDDFDYYRQFAIRTGSADYSFKVIANGWIKKGWCGSDKGLRKIGDCVKDKDKWKCINPLAENPPSWASEKDFFDWLGVKWIHPKERI